MTEENWLKATNPIMLLHILGHPFVIRNNARIHPIATERKINLFLEACSQLRESYKNSGSKIQDRQESESRFVRRANANGPVSAETGLELGFLVAMFGTDVGLETQCALLRCIFGNPFRPITFDHSWLNPKLVRLAQAIYDERTFDQMPTLAGALEKSGCDNAEILSHCRGNGPHVRGCWVVDAVLGKE